MSMYPLVAEYEALAKKDKVTRPGQSMAKVTAALGIDLDGQVKQVVRLISNDTRGKKTVEVPQLMQVPEQVTRSSGISPNFLCDNSSYILGFDTKGKPERSKECFAASKKLHLEILKDCTSNAAVAVKAFFTNWDVDGAAAHPIVGEYHELLAAASNIVFFVDVNDLEYAHEDSEIQEAWTRYREQQSGGDSGICLVTGEHTRIARIHGLIKGVPGAQSSGASLVGFNAPAFQSYGKEQSYNAPVGEYAMYAYTTALNYLIGNQNSRSFIGDTTIIYWAADGEEVYQKTYNAVMEPTADNREIIDGVFKNLEKNWEVDVDGVFEEISRDQKFYIWGLSPNAARLAIRFKYEDSFGNILCNLKAHYDRMEIVRPAMDQVNYMGVWRMLQEIVNKKSKDKKPPDNLVGTVYRAIVSGGRYPEELYQAVLQRIRAEQDNPETRTYKITPGRVAIIKAYLIRNTRLSEKEEITVALNENNKSVPYALGRTFAVLEKIQEDANPGIVSTIKDRYFNSACATPAIIFPVLFRLKNSHMKKLLVQGKVGIERTHEKRLWALLNCIPVNDEQELAYPKRLSLEEQGMFILGYYQQRQKLFEKKEVKEEKEEEK